MKHNNAMLTIHPLGYSDMKLQRKLIKTKRYLIWTGLRWGIVLRPLTNSDIQLLDGEYVVQPTTRDFIVVTQDATYNGRKFHKRKNPMILRPCSSDPLESSWAILNQVEDSQSLVEVSKGDILTAVWKSVDELSEHERGKIHYSVFKYDSFTYPRS